jgi:hypothetical protein
MAGLQKTIDWYADNLVMEDERQDQRKVAHA